MTNKDDAPVAVLVTLLLGLFMGMVGWFMVIISFVYDDRRYFVAGALLCAWLWLIRITLVPAKR